MIVVAVVGFLLSWAMVLVLFALDFSAMLNSALPPVAPGVRAPSPPPAPEAAALLPAVLRAGALCCGLAAAATIFLLNAGLERRTAVLWVASGPLAVIVINLGLTAADPVAFWLGAKWATSSVSIHASDWASLVVLCAAILVSAVVALARRPA